MDCCRRLRGRCKGIEGNGDWAIGTGRIETFCQCPLPSAYSLLSTSVLFHRAHAVVAPQVLRLALGRFEHLRIDTPLQQRQRMREHKRVSQVRVANAAGFVETIAEVLPREHL